MEQQDKFTSQAPQNAPSREELEQHLRARAWKDDAFRQEFLTNPKAVLERDYATCFPGGKIPSELSIKVVEENEQEICFILPPREPDALPEIDMLKEEDVLEITGGVETGRATNCTCVTCPRWYCGDGLKNVLNNIRRI